MKTLPQSIYAKKAISWTPDGGKRKRSTPKNIWRRTIQQDLKIAGKRSGRVLKGRLLIESDEKRLLPDTSLDVGGPNLKILIFHGNCEIFIVNISMVKLLMECESSCF